MNRGTLFSGAVFDLDAGAVTIALPEARGRFISMQVIDEEEYTDEADYKPGGHIITKLGIGTALPVWLPELTIGDLQVAKNVFDLRFWRDDEATRFETLKGDPGAVALRSYATSTARWCNALPKPRTGTRPALVSHSSVRELPPPRTTDFSVSKLRYANSDAATGKIGDRTVKTP